MLEIHTEVHVNGPIFDARIHAAIDDYAQAVVDDVADQGFRDVHSTLSRVLRHPTGYYQSRIRNQAVGSAQVIHDDRVIYGRWLEGTGSRNSPVTRFPGYFTFRLVAQALNKKAPQIAERTLRRFIGRMR